MVNLVETILSEAVDVTFITFGQGAYDGRGNWVEGQPKEVPDMATVQPASGQVLRDTPEGVRDDVAWCIWTPFAVKNNHQVIYAGETYRVLHTWPRPQEGFVKAVIGRLRHES